MATSTRGEATATGSSAWGECCIDLPNFRFRRSLDRRSWRRARSTSSPWTLAATSGPGAGASSASWDPVPSQCRQARQGERAHVGRCGIGGADVQRRTQVRWHGLGVGRVHRTDRRRVLVAGAPALRPHGHHEDRRGRRPPARAEGRRHGLGGGRELGGTARRRHADRAFHRSPTRRTRGSRRSRSATAPSTPHTASTRPVRCRAKARTMSASAAWARPRPPPA